MASINYLFVFYLLPIVKDGIVVTNCERPPILGNLINVINIRPIINFLAGDKCYAIFPRGN